MDSSGDQRFRTLANGDQLSEMELDILYGQTRSEWRDAQAKGDLHLTGALEQKLMLIQKSWLGGFEPEG
jgi:hypothetical protein